MAAVQVKVCCTLPRGGGSSSVCNGALSVEVCDESGDGIDWAFVVWTIAYAPRVQHARFDFGQLCAYGMRTRRHWAHRIWRGCSRPHNGASSSSVAVEQEAAGKRSRVDEEAEAEAAVAAVAAYEAEANQAAAAPSVASSTAASPVKGEPWACSAARCSTRRRTALYPVRCDERRHAGRRVDPRPAAAAASAQPSQQPERREQKRGGGGNAQSGRGRGRGSKQLQTQNTERSIAAALARSRERVR